MKKFLLFLLVFIPTAAPAPCMHGYLDKDGQFQGVPCGEHKLDAKCSETYRGHYWDGKSCRKIEIIQRCENQGGTWEQVLIWGGKRKRPLTGMCLCPDKKVWDGKNCRADIPLSRQCVNSETNGYARMTEEFFGARNCPRESKK